MGRTHCPCEFWGRVFGPLTVAFGHHLFQSGTDSPKLPLDSPKLFNLAFVARQLRGVVVIENHPAVNASNPARKTLFNQAGFAALRLDAVFFSVALNVVVPLRL